ncbi:hypothetical protein STAFG_5855 [Streptomyces afghaniensis 772]|uniref:ABC3 transporter permease C-terminal domain-containing protein n=1 Tax=Streptomyces afghaniensis 772 TaxID=1283301 RepID=S4MNB6_9ACTN|nr:hypothetical protein STAFG_5855 [Streptomyces afghaniensis 772]
MIDGSLRDLGTDGIAITEEEADRQHLTTGEKAQLTFTDGRKETFTVRAVYGQSELAGDYVITRAAWAPHRTQDSDTLVAVTFEDGVSTDAGKAAVEKTAARYGNPEVQTRDEYAQSSAGGVDMVLTPVYALLALAVVIALLGIANTLTLAMHERTRELGLLRAVGQTRSQLRAMVRWESVLVAAFGTAGGLALGAFLGWVLVRASDGASDSAFAFAVPPAQPAVVALVGLTAGALAGLRPAGARHAWTCCAPSPPSDAREVRPRDPRANGGHARSTGNGGPGGSMFGQQPVGGVPDLREPARGFLQDRAPRPARRRRDRGGGRREGEPDDLAGLAVRPDAPALAHGGHHREPAPTGRQRLGVVDHGHPRVVVAHRDREPVEQQLYLHGARLVGLGMPVDVGQQLRHPERGPVDQSVQMPVAQLRRDDSADLADPRRQGLELHRAVPAWVADHGCDSPT